MLLRGLPVWLGLGLVSLVTAIGMLLVFRATLSVSRVEAAKRRIHAGIFEMRLFQDDLAAVLRGAGDVFRYNGAYLAAWLIPLVIVSVPLVWLVTPLDRVFGQRGLAAGHETVVTAHVGGGAALSRVDVERLVLQVPQGVQVETPAIWFPASRQALWRVTPLIAAEFISNVSVSGAAPESAVTAVDVAYPRREVNLLGWRTSWLVPYCGLVVVCALALKRPFGVVF